MNTMLEQADSMSLAGAVEWRCHGCGALLLTREDLQKRDERLLCEVCEAIQSEMIGG